MLGAIPHRRDSTRWSSRLRRLSATARRLRLAVVAALAATFASGWPAIGLLAGLAAWSLPLLIADTRARREARLTRREAMAKWLEMLADGFKAGGFLQTTIRSTADLAPPAIRAEVARLCDRLAAEGPAGFAAALQEFADRFASRDVDDACVALVDAAQGQARDLSHVIRKAATDIREGVAVDRDIESGDRKMVYVELRFTEAYMAAIGLLLAARLAYFAPLWSPGWQIYVAVVGVIALVLLRSIASLASPRPEDRVVSVVELVER